jgi:hypothetical protein
MDLLLELDWKFCAATTDKVKDRDFFFIVLDPGKTKIKSLASGEDLIDASSHAKGRGVSRKRERAMRVKLAFKTNSYININLFIRPERS